VLLYRDQQQVVETTELVAQVCLIPRISPSSIPPMFPDSRREMS
jgi:hypothetical protein